MSQKKPEAAVLDHFRVSDPSHIVETGLANIWQVRCQNGHRAALKIYHGPDMRNEEAGYDLLKQWNGRGAALLLDKTSNAALIEWLGGHSLGDLTRSNKDGKANAILLEVANKLHSVSMTKAVALPLVADWFEDLICLEIGPSCPTTAQRDIDKAKKLAVELMASQQNVVPLHGDLHHDNIRLGDRGYCAFDAKGVLGERAYELANAFRNPAGAKTTVMDPRRIKGMADQWSSGFNVDRQRLLNWAAAKCGLSIAWRSKGIVEQDPEFDLLAALVGVASNDL